MSGFTEEWFDPVSQDRLAILGRSVENVPGLVIEVGSWEGRSTCVLANAIRPRPVEAVDTFQGSPGEESATLAAERDVFATFLDNIKDRTGGNVRVHVGGWRDVLPQLDGPIALCFIDAEHTRSEVADNIRAVLSRLSPGGVICGDDAGHEPVREGVGDVLPVDDVLVHGNVWYWRKPVSTDGLLSTEEIRRYEATSILETMYLQQCNTPSDIYLHLPRFVAMVELANAKKVIELGTRTGVSTIAWLYALERNGGRLWSVDMDAKPPIGDYPHWEFIQGDDEDDAVFNALPDEVDILFLDTSHLYQHTRRELRKYLPKVRKGGVIVCHDTELDYPEGWTRGEDPVFPVKRAIEEFCTEYGLNWFNVPECWGLGVIEVR